MTPAVAPPPPADAGARNLLLLVQLRWLAVGGQLATILGVHYLLHVRLPLVPMVAAVGAQVALNLATLAARRRGATNAQLFAALLFDVACLTVQFYLSGGASNPFISLYLLQVVLGAVLLEAWSSWVLVALTSAAFALLMLVRHQPRVPPSLAGAPSDPYVFGNWFSFTLSSVLLVLFVTRIAINLRERDQHLAALRQRAAEEEHIVRMGLLASGAAHELGTPLASLSVALGDWKGEPAIAATPHLAAEVEEMRAEDARCKTIVGGILFAAGEVTGESPARTTLRRFVTGTVAAWSQPELVTLDDRLGADLAIVGDRALAQALVNLLDNAVEAGATRITLAAERRDGALSLSVRDDGRGFPPAILSAIGKPYQSSKDRRGAGLGLFLATNVLRTLGGTLHAGNRATGGAEVRLLLPLDALSLEEDS